MQLTITRSLSFTEYPDQNKILDPLSELLPINGRLLHDQLIKAFMRIGTRGSKLALWQANNLKRQLAGKGVDCSLVIIKTKGDRIQDLSFNKIEGKGFFTKEIEDALVEDEIDVAVHSMKDLPTSGHKSLIIAGVSQRADPRDVLIIRADAVDPKKAIKLKAGSTVGTSSIRRKVQMAHFDPDCKLIDIRGNVPTRLKKVVDRQVDAIVLAAAGLDRLSIDLSEFEVIRFNPLEFIPAPAQGVVAYQCRRKDTYSKAVIKEVHHRDVAVCTNVERKVLNLLDGGCQLPLGAYCTRDQNGFHCYTMLGTEPGKPIARKTYSQSTSVGMAEYIVSHLNL